MIRIVFFLVLSLCSVLVQAQATKLSDYYDLIYQVKVISPQAGSKSSIGSGFQVTAEGLIITNYHVVSAYVNSPGTHEIHYLSQSGEQGVLELLDFDVVNDLAVLKHPKPRPAMMNLADSVPLKGETIYALGNPHDYGVILVPGPNNGFVEHSYNDKILFSGSLNAGMSGGPAFNKRGQIVGVNVATAGSQLSFLVPVEYVKKILARSERIDPSEYDAKITNQIKGWQRPRIQQLIDQPWPTENFAKLSLFGEIRKDFQCWGGTNEKQEKRPVEQIYKNCRAGDSLYLSHAVRTGDIVFSFQKSVSLELNSFQFTQALGVQMQADNMSDYENSTNYKCHTDFLKTEKSKNINSSKASYAKATLCVRAYKRFVGLYDSLLLVELISNKQAVKSHLSLSGVERDQIQILNRKFTDEATL